MDFTLRTLRILLYALKDQGFSFLTFEESLSSLHTKTIVLRHDVDLLPLNSLEFAKIQADLGYKGSYYFRISPKSFDESIIKEIYKLGHEIGYHYEELSFAWAKIWAQGIVQEEELVNIAIESFRKNLEMLRKIVPVKTICMHGSPMSRWDNRLLWKYYDYRDFVIVGEPYFDIDFNEVMYLTDTGRRWDGENVAIRDKADGRKQMTEGENPFKYWTVKPVQYRKENQNRGNEEARIRIDDEISSINSSLPPSAHCLPSFPRFNSTFDIIRTAEQGKLPDKIMMTFHPQRWTDTPLPWVKELVWQNVKNVGKYFLVKIR